MGSLTNYAENAIMGHLFASAYTAPSAVYLALCTADPGEAATGASMSEVANSGSYARQAITFGAASSRRVTQSGAVTFTQATGSWGTVTHWVVVDSATHGAGNALAYGSLGESKTVISGNTPSVGTGIVYVEISASNGASNYLANTALDHMFRNQAWSQPATYVGFTTTTSSDSTAGTAVNGGSYARTLVNKASGASPAWSSVSGGAVSNANAITSPTATASWGTVVSMTIHDASSSGNFLIYDNGMTDQTVGTGDSLTYAIGDLDVSLS